MLPLAISYGMTTDMEKYIFNESKIQLCGKSQGGEVILSAFGYFINIFSLQIKLST